MTRSAHLNANNGFPYVEDLFTQELDVNKYLAPDGAGGVQWLLHLSAVATKKDKDLQANVTVNDGDKAMNATVSDTPSYGGYVFVFVNGKEVSVGDAVKTKDCYFSGDNGVTARAIEDISAGDTLHWVGSVALYQLDVSDCIDLDYDI